MSESPRPQHSTDHVRPPTADPRAREKAVTSMVSASFMAVLGMLLFAWALRAPDYPWLFAVGALPWVTGVIVFARALWRYTHV